MRLMNIVTRKEVCEMNINDILVKKIDNLTIEDENKIVNSLCNRFIIEHQKNDKSGIYGKTQYMFAFNSNHMEGSTLTINQTRSLFQTGTLPQSDETYIAKDIEEAQGHFLMFNEMLHTYDHELSEELIKKYHFRLKQGVFEDQANGYPCGEYKSRANFVGDIITAKPNEVPQKMQELLEWYNDQDKALEVILKFHAIYENIHPFQDGNGRTGRMILFKECLSNGIIPVLFTNDIQHAYKLALNKAQKLGDYTELLDIAKMSQMNYYKEIQEFLYDYSLERNVNQTSLKETKDKAKSKKKQSNKDQ